VSRACGVSWSEDESRRHGDAVLMTWDNARAMRAAGMSIGSHTSSHRVLQTLTPADLAQELSASRAELTRQLGEPITTIAYPVGRSIAGLPAVRQALAEAGYELGFTAVGGINRPPPDDDAFDLRRLMIDRGLPEEWTRWRVALPLLN
jgi:peptidoglycan/xylan/chitin deacetylase (PgdA/CDA1 family)